MVAVNYVTINQLKDSVEKVTMNKIKRYKDITDVNLYRLNTSH